MKKRILKITTIMIMFILVYNTIVNALSFTATMTPNSTTVPESTEVTITVKVSNLDVGANGINTLSGYLKYDETVFETINDTNIDGLNSWSPSYGADAGKITLTKTTFTKTEEQVFSVTLKTKSGISGKSGQVNFTNIVASNSEKTISASDISTTITVGTAAENVTNTTNNAAIPVNITIPTNNTVRNNTIVNSTTNNTANNAVNNTPISSYINGYTTNTSSGDDIPHTGVEDTIMYAIGAIIVIAIVFYIKFEIVNKEMK